MTATATRDEPEGRAKSYTVSLTPLLKKQVDERVESLRPKVSGFSNYLQQLIVEDLRGTRFDAMKLYKLLEPVHTQMNVVMDITRHSCASYWLAQVEDAAAVAEQLGHNVNTLKRHYRALVTREDAARFWAILPTKSPASDGGACVG